MFKHVHPTVLVGQPFPRLKALLKDRDGIAAMEFALIAPMILVVYMGLAEFSIALTVDRKISHSSSVAGDLATQVASIDKSDAEDIVAATLRIAEAKNPASYVLHLESFERESDGSINSLGEIVYNNANAENLPDFDVTTLSTQLLSEDSGIVVARVSYEYEPIGLKKVKNDGSEGQSFLPTKFTMSETFMLKPRRSETVTFGASDKGGFDCTGTDTSISCTVKDKAAEGGEG